MATIIIEILFNIAEQADGRTHEIEVIQYIRTHCRMSRSALFRWSACFNTSRNTANGPTTNTACAKCKILVEPIIQLIPLALLDQLGDTLTSPSRKKVGTCPDFQVFNSAVEERAIRACSFNFFNYTHCLRR